ncbi:hypothetical protein BGY98DRAFT_90092 [Russula aff. rugulosa BPL654]|nr:hypothetical protein BGY98DRAFT_90092 [Russula aff. rugulosa BPL654]
MTCAIPDTLWCHLFFMTDPFIIAETPDICANGCQLRFATCLVKDGKRKSRKLLIPSLPKVVFWPVGFKSGCPDSKTEGRYPSTLRVMTCLGAIRPLAARERMFLLSLSPSRIGNRLWYS